MEFHQNGNDERYFSCNEYFRKRNENSDFVYSQIPEMSQVQWNKQGSTFRH